MRLMKYSFICPICDKSYYTYIEQKNLQEMINDKDSIEQIFSSYPDYYQKMIQTSICSACQHINKTICLSEQDSRDEILYTNIQTLELDARKAI